MSKVMSYITLAKFLDKYGPRIDTSQGDEQGANNYDNGIGEKWSAKDKGNLLRIAVAVEAMVAMLTEVQKIGKKIDKLSKQLKPMTDDARFVAFVAECETEAKLRKDK